MIFAPHFSYSHLTLEITQARATAPFLIREKGCQLGASATYVAGDTSTLVQVSLP